MTLSPSRRGVFGPKDWLYFHKIIKMVTSPTSTPDTMAAGYYVDRATADDASVIASLFASSWLSPFAKLQFGAIDPPSFAKAMAPRIAEQMDMENVIFLVVREPNTQGIVSVAHWTLSSNDSDQDPEATEENDERQQLEDEIYFKKLPEGCNMELIMYFTIQLRTLRKETLQGRKHYRKYTKTHHVGPQRTLEAHFRYNISIGKYFHSHRPPRKGPCLQVDRMGPATRRRARSPGILRYRQRQRRETVV